MKPIKIYPGIILVITAVCCMASVLVFADSTEKSIHKNRSNLPITIKSNELSADNKGKTAIFIGKVVAKQGDITIYSDKLTVYYGEKKEDLEKIEADGNVRIVQTNSIGTASHALYESREGKITLTGNPKVLKGSDTVSGSTITYYVDEEKSTASGDGTKQRVEVTIHPPQRKGNAGTR